MTIVNDIKKTENNFVTALGSGKAATKYLYIMAVHAAHNRDVSCLMNAGRRALKKGDDAGVKIVQKTIVSLYPHGKAEEGAFKLNKSQPDTAFLGKLEAAAKADLSIRGAKFMQEVFGKEKAAYDLAKAADAMVRKAMKEGHKSPAIKAAIDAAIKEAVAAEIKKAA